MAYMLLCLQMLLSVAEISGVSTKETTATVQQRQLHNEEEPMRNLEEMIQDGIYLFIFSFSYCSSQFLLVIIYHKLH